MSSPGFSSSHERSVPPKSPQTLHRLVILREAEDLLFAYAGEHAEGTPLLRLHSASRSRTLYIGVTNNLTRRLDEHREGRADAFTARYNITLLVYFERFQYVQEAIAREKYLKHFTRAEKLALVIDSNPTWSPDALGSNVGSSLPENKADPPLREG